MNENFLRKLQTPLISGMHINEDYTMPSISSRYIYRVEKESLYKKFGQKISENIINYLGVKLGEENKSFNNIDDFNI